MSAEEKAQCWQCGSTDLHLSEIKNCGVPWKYVVACEICLAAASGSSPAEAERKLTEGNSDLELMTHLTRLHIE